MARKGSSKVRTGCLTCKIRKVKCDEGKPHCQRCTGTGRRCDGYASAALPSALVWHRPRHLYPNIDDFSERRSLHFFCETAAPFLSGPMDPYFWTHLVLQFSSFEPAVRHSVVAISSLYEQIQCRPRSAQLLADNSLALRHYNAAIRELKSVKNEPLVLLVCILFICIEFMQGNREAAIEHCKHGVHILERIESSYPWTKEYLSPIFRRILVFPFFFGSTSESFPKLIGLDEAMPPSFNTFDEAQYYVDGIITRTVRLVRCGDLYRLGELRRDPVSAGLLREQQGIQSALDSWHASFLGLQGRVSTPGRREAGVCNMLLRYEIGRIWATTCFNYDETTYDEFLTRFRWMTEQATKLASSPDFEHVKHNGAPRFTFEMGFTPLLYYIVMKCRCLNTRIQALSLMKRLAATKENLWEVASLYATGRRIIEIEHDVSLDDGGRPAGQAYWPGLPPDEMRIRDSTTNPNLVTQRDANGQEVIGRMAGFFRRKPEGDIYLQTEFVSGTKWT